MGNKHVNRSNLLVYLVSIFAITLWGISYIWTDMLIRLDIPVFYFVFVRILLAGIILFLLNATRGRVTRIHRKDLPKFLLLAFFEPFIYFLCESYGIKETGSPTLSAMIMSKGELGENFILGIVLLVIAVISEVGHASVTKSLSNNYSSQVIVMYQFLIGSVYLLPLFIVKGLDNFSMAYLSADVLYPILCLAFLCSSLAFSLWVSTIKNLGVAKSSIFTALIPVVAAIVAWILGDENLNGRQACGIILSTIGVILSQYTVRKAKKED